MIKTYRFLIMLCLFCLFSCNKEQTKDGEILRQAEQAIEEQPDSVLVWLQSIENPQELPQSQKADFYLLLTRAKLKNNDQIFQDSLTSGLTESVDYYSKEKDKEKLAYAYFLRNKTFFDSSKETGDVQKAMLDCLEAKNIAEEIQDERLLRMIFLDMGNLHYAQSNFDEALVNYKISKQYYSKEKDIKSETILCGKIGSVYNTIQQYDSAMVYQKQALEYTLARKDTSEYNTYILASLYKNIGFTYDKMGNYEQARDALITAYRIIPPKEVADINIIIWSLGRVYDHLNLPDSAVYYARQYRENNHETLNEKALRSHHWYMLYKRTGNYPLSLENLESLVSLSDDIYKETLSQSVLEIQKKYDKEVLENRYNHVLVQRLYLIITIIAVILLGVLAAWFFRNRIKRRESELLEAEQALQTFQGMLDSRDEQLQAYSQLLTEQAEHLQDYHRIVTERDEKSEQLRAILVDKLDIARRVAQMNVVSSDNTEAFMKQFHKAFGKNLLEWDYIYPVINDLYDEFVDKIKAAHPELNGKDLQLCCFVRAGFRTEELAVLLGYTQNSIRVKRAQLVKKMGFKNAESFLSYLMKM